MLFRIISLIGLTCSIAFAHAEIIKVDDYIEGADPGVKLFVRNKFAEPGIPPISQTLFITQFDVVRTQMDLIGIDACGALPGYRTLQYIQRFLILLQTCLGKSFS